MRASTENAEIDNDSTAPLLPPGSLQLVRPQAATCVIEGVVPDPLLSSRARGWNGLTLELHSFHQLDASVQPPDHVIAVHVAGSVNLRQARDGRTSVRKMTSGDIAITPVGSPTRWQQAGQSLVILLRLSPAYLRMVAADECAMDPDRFAIQSVFATRDAVIEQLGRRLLAGLELEGVDSHLYVDTLTCELAIHILRRYTTALVQDWSRTKLSPHKLRRAILYIDENLCNQLALAAMANAVALSPGHFAHAFREATGVAPHRYVLERRVERAKELLRQSDLPITEIASRVGCSSHSHFSVLFNRVTGLTPRQFRALS
jgi:AraC family transcriptional regulator